MALRIEDHSAIGDEIFFVAGTIGLHEDDCPDARVYIDIAKRTDDSFEEDKAEALRLAHLFAAAEDMLETLQRIARWQGEFPETGQFWKGTDDPMSYGAAYGSNGERDFMRNLAVNAINKARGVAG